MLLIDASENLWNQLRTVNDQQEAQDGQTLGTAQLAQQLLLFLNSYLMLQDGSQLAVYAIDSCGRHDWVRYRMSSLCYADMLAGCSHLLFLSAKLPGSQGNSAGQSSEAAAELVLGKLTQHMARRHESSGVHAALQFLLPTLAQWVSSLMCFSAMPFLFKASHT